MIKGDVTKTEKLVNNETNKYIVSKKEYNSVGQVVKVIDANGNVSSIEYDEYSLYPKTVTNPKQQILELEYNYKVGKLESSKDVNNVVTKTIFDGLGRVMEEQISSPENVENLIPIKKYTYNLETYPYSVTNTVVIDNAENETSNEIIYLDGLGREIQTCQEIAGNKYITANIVYGKNGKEEKQSVPYYSGCVEYNKENVKVWVENKYDVLDRVVEVKDNIGVTKTEYGLNEIIVTNVKGQETKTKYNSREQVEEVTNYLLGENESVIEISTKYEYNSLGQLIKIIDPEGNKREFSYDVLGNILKASEWYRNDAEVNSIKNWEYEYDDNNNVLKVTDPKEQEINNEYDELNRLVKTSIFGNSNEVQKEINYEYDTAENGVGKLTSVTNSVDGNKQEYSYDKLSRLSKTLYLVEGKEYMVETKVDMLERIKEVLYPSGIIVNYDYDKQNNIIKVIKKKTKNSEPETVIEKVVYSPLNQIELVEYGNGTETVNVYEETEMYRLVGKQTIKDTELKQYFEYTYDEIGNITKIEDNKKQETSNYEYDTLNRLRKVNVTGTEDSYNRTYEYDKIGNIIYKSDIGTYEYNNPNPQQVTKIVGNGFKPFLQTEYEYDQNGNRTKKTTTYAQGVPASGGEITTYNWNELNQLVSVQNTDDEVLEKYKYNELGERIIKTNGAEDITVYIGKLYDYEMIENKEKINNYIFLGNTRVATVNDSKDLNPLVTEIEEISKKIDRITELYREARESRDRDSLEQIRIGFNNLLKESFWYTLCTSNTLSTKSTRDILVIVDTNKTTYHHADHLGSASISTDKTGEVVSNIIYYPYGEVRAETSTEEQKYKYNDKELDSTGLYYYGARYYDAEIGVWISNDPLQRSVGEMVESGEFNGYRYVLNNPLVYVDPKGESATLQSTMRQLHNLNNQTSGAIAKNINTTIQGTKKALVATAGVVGAVGVVSVAYMTGALANPAVLGATANVAERAYSDYTDDGKFNDSGQAYAGSAIIGAIGSSVLQKANFLSTITGAGVQEGVENIVLDGKIDLNSISSSIIGATFTFGIFGKESSKIVKPLLDATISEVSKAFTELVVTITSNEVIKDITKNKD